MQVVDLIASWPEAAGPALQFHAAVGRRSVTVIDQTVLGLPLLGTWTLLI